MTGVSESDAGPYICKINNGYTSLEKKIILKVTHIVPQFQGNGYIALKTLSAAYVSFDIEVAVKPIGKLNSFCKIYNIIIQMKDFI